MKRAVVYGAGSSIVRRVITSDDTNYDFSVHVGPDEELYVEGTRTAPDLMLPPDCAVVDENNLVVAMIKADPTGTVVQPPAQLIEAYPGVFVGCTYDAANDIFVAPIEQHPGGTSPDGTPYPPYQTGGPIERPVP